MASAEIINLNDSTPAAPSGYQNAKWQKGATTGNDPTYGYPINPASSNVPNTGGVNAQTASYTAVAADCGKLISFNSASTVTLTLPAAIPFGQWCIFVECVGAGGLTISPNGLTLDGSGSSISLVQNQGIYITTDGTNYKTARGMVTNLGIAAQFVLNTGAVKNDAALTPLASGAVPQFTECVVYTAGSDASVDLTFDITKNGTSIFSAAQTITHGTASGTITTITALAVSPTPVSAKDKFKINITSGSSNWIFTAQLE